MGGENKCEPITLGNRKAINEGSRVVATSLLPTARE